MDRLHGKEDNISIDNDVNRCGNRGHLSGDAK